MADVDPKLVATRWLKKWAVYPSDAKGRWPLEDDDDDSTDLDWTLPRTNPEVCLDAILDVLARLTPADTDHYLPVLAAGPLEDLLCNHGPRCVDRVDLLARRDPLFRKLMHGIYTTGVDPDVMARLSK